MRYNTLLLDLDNWDLVIDSAGNVAVASPPYSLAQDVASAIRLFLGEQWYASDTGVPYYSEILGKLPSQSLFIKMLEAAALRVPGVSMVRVILSTFSNRIVSGQVQFIDEAGVTNNVSF